MGSIIWVDAYMGVNDGISSSVRSVIWVDAYMGSILRKYIGIVVVGRWRIIVIGGHIIG